MLLLYILEGRSKTSFSCIRPFRKICRIAVIFHWFHRNFSQGKDGFLLSGLISEGLDILGKCHLGNRHFTNHLHGFWVYPNTVRNPLGMCHREKYKGDVKMDLKWYCFAMSRFAFVTLLSDKGLWGEGSGFPFVFTLTHLKLPQTQHLLWMYWTKESFADQDSPALGSRNKENMQAKSGKHTRSVKVHQIKLEGILHSCGLLSAK